MKRVKVQTDSGAVRELIFYNVSERVDVKKSKPPRPRFKDEEERAAFCLAVARRRHVQKVNANFGPSSYYSTLTLDNEHEVHTFPEARRIQDNFMRCIKYHCPDAKIIIYMGRGKSTHRIHFHMLSEGVPEAVIAKLWRYGEIRQISRLRAHNYYNGIDHGQDYTGLANYLFDHWTPEQGGRRRYKQTANLRKPEKERPVEVRREYSPSRPPITPKGYILVERKNTKYGYLYFKYVRQPEPKRRAAA